MCLSTSCVFAEENTTDTDIIYGNYTELNQEIANSNDELNLTRDYVQNSTNETIEFSKSMTVNGNGHVLNNYTEIIINTQNNELTLILNNVTFNNSLNINTENASQNSFNITFFNCKILPNLNLSSEISSYYPEPSYSGNITPIVKKVAKLIVGSSKDFKAIEKIVTWINKNTKHETKEGFYQDPSSTLCRLTGNCCSLTDLFFQMCDAVGLTKNHKFCYVHVGNLTFGSRHFFATVDNITVDVGLDDPWSDGGFRGRAVYNITPYPYLPLPRNY